MPEWWAFCDYVVTWHHLRMVIIGHISTTHPCYWVWVGAFSGKHPMEVMISIHAPLWGATTSITIDISVGRFQSTHPVIRVRPPCWWVVRVAMISIHHNPLRACTHLLISIHAPIVWVCDLTAQPSQGLHSYFNPRTHNMSTVAHSCTTVV